ncbi:MAG: lysophospholipid acyltransferase family protein [Gordonia sp. (in: high G+C Gram-positive bacteria)]|uniref:lysophospholipid acyltransferase family protein n=1 Tax=Gordonia sp. (in: high G+C Gram-positive bacteria) TaxID=84139 RepID=UPI0039E52E7B
MLRLLAVAVLLCTLVPAGTLTLAVPRRARVRYWRFTARCSLVAVGLRVDVVDHRPRGARHLRGALVVANHISFFDVLAVAAVTPARFVAKREVVSMAVGPVLRCFGVLPHVRGDLRGLPPILERVRTILDRGRPVVVFPEGTTWCGVAGGRFRPAFFQAALDTGVPVLPIRISYREGGRTATEAGFVGDDELGDTLRRVLRARSLRVRVVVHPLQLPVGDRKRLAAHCERLIRPAPAVTDLGTLSLGRGAGRGYPGPRSCPSISTTPPPPRSSPLPSRR